MEVLAYMTNLWEEYSRTKAADIREELIINYIDIVKFIAGRLYASYGSNVEFDDLVSYGVFGLMDAIDKYDITRGVKFETYAQLRIRGAIIDQLREMDWLPRSVRQKSKEIEKAYYDLERELGRPATDEEMADNLGLSLEDFQKKIQNITAYSIVSLDDLLEQKREITTGEDDNQIETPENAVKNNEIKEMLIAAINNLPEKEKKVVSLYYYDELTYKEIGKILSISESRVSQIHTKAIIRLKNKIKNLFEG